MNTATHEASKHRITKTRLAPTPSGFLHAGNAFSFVLTWLLARQTGGSLLLRIDDLDSDRVRPAYIADVFETLHWLGLDWDDGPRNPEEFAERFSQTHRLGLYHDLLRRLRTETDLVYACDCSRAKILKNAPNGLYPGTCRHRNLPLDAPGVAWRIRVPENAHITPNDIRRKDETCNVAALMGDFVVRRKDGVPAYQVASLADDLHFGINCIVRGADLLPSTAAQVWLAQLLGADAFANAAFHHHPLLTDETGSKLSKSAGAASLKAVREAGQSPAGIFRRVARYLGLPAESIETAQDLLRTATGHKADLWNLR